MEKSKQRINKFLYPCSQCNLLMKFNFVHQSTQMHHQILNITQSALHRAMKTMANKDTISISSYNLEYLSESKTHQPPRKNHDFFQPKFGGNKSDNIYN